MRFLLLYVLTVPFTTVGFVVGIAWEAIKAGYECANDFIDRAAREW